MSFQCKIKVLTELKWKTIHALTFFGYEEGLVFPIYFLDQTFVDSIDLVLLIDHDSQCRNWIRSSLFQLSNKKSNKSQI